ncbi:uncharacterized protein [Watersipora subatra]|uniref:uncharacterized protein n=1 Tax=Watersipora subatra TaxID=2589382 RepID=UPI00355C1C66
MSGATRPPARGKAAPNSNSQFCNSRPPKYGHMHMSNPTQLPPMPYNNAQMYIPGTPITYPGGQITASVPGFPQHYHVMNPHTNPVAGQYWSPSAMATHSFPAQAQPSTRPASNPSISAAVPPNMTMSSSFNGTMQQSQMQPTPQSNPYSQSLAQNLTRMPTQEPVLKATLSDRELMPPPAPVVPSVPVPTTPPVTENKEKKPNPVVSSPAKASKSKPSHSSPLTTLHEQKSDDGKVKTYTRDFLMSLKEAELSKVKPYALNTAIQEITYSGRSLPAMSVSKRDLNPEYFRPNSSPCGSTGNKRSSMSRDNKSMDATVGNKQHKISFFWEESPRGSTGNKRSSMSRDNRSMDATVENKQHKISFFWEETPARPNKTAQVKGQVAQVASLSSSSVSSVSESTPPVLSLSVPSGSAEQPTSHPDKEASVTAAAAPSTPVLIKSKKFDERQFDNSVAASVDFTDIAASETSHKLYDREKKFLSTVPEKQESKGTCHQQESAVTGSSVTSYLPGAARNMSDGRDSHLNLASEYNDREDQVGGAYADLGRAHTVVLPITESKSSIDEYLDNIDFKVDMKKASNSTQFNMRRLLNLSHVEIGDDCDTALHYSAYLNQPDMLKLLLERGLNINAVNEGGCSTLHVAVKSQHLDCVQVLIEHDCDVNIQDTYGDTPLHDAIGKESTEIVRMLMDHVDIDFSLKNKRGFNALHHAALKGNCFAVEKTLFRAPKMVDLPKDDGFSSLHIASLNGHSSVVQGLLKQGHADINLRNRRQQTPLMLACAQGHQTIVKILVESGASVTIVDEEGHTALHHVLLRLHINGMTSSNSSQADQAAISDMLPEATQESAAIAKVLAENNADALQVNFQGQAPLDLVADYGIKTELEKYCTFPPCIVCEEEDARVIFLPCKHRCTCNYCSKRMKKCLKCQTPIKKKLLDGADLTRDSAPYEAVKELNIVLQEMEGIQLCEICMDRKRNLVFACGHTACDKCAQSLKICHNCRKPITLRIPLFI